jgi:hypothetical protein
MPLTRRQFLHRSATGAVCSVLAPAMSAVAAAPAGLDDALRQDAATAWRFFEAWDGMAPSMVPANGWFEGDAVGHHDVLTMWDIGSLILAGVAARRLDLIDDATFERRSADVLTFLGGALYLQDGRWLLNYRSNPIDGSSVEPGFDSTDAGRLLIALKVLDDATDGSFKLERQIRGWNIESTVIDGAMHDIKLGEIAPARSFVYAPYVSRGYSYWGIEHDPVVPVANPLADEASRKAYLDHVASIGTIATEPHLSEAVEVGMSPHGQVISDVLHEAQIRRHAETGALTCVTEGPIDREPWFTYQGYEMGEDGGAWRVYATYVAPEWNDPAFIDNTRMVSTKAAFLWRAVRADDYSKMLHEHVREGASDRLGFSAGRYEVGGAVANVYDINTNALVLEALAFIHSGGRPLADISA